MNQSQITTSDLLARMQQALAARDTDKSALRNFRVSRIEELESNVAKSAMTDS